LCRHVPKLAGSAVDERAEVDPLACGTARRMDLGGKIEIVDCGQQQPRLPDDFRRALAVAASAGPRY